MSHQCRSCGRDLNNNYAPYTSGYPNANQNGNDRQSISSYNSTTSRSCTSNLDGSPSTVTAKVMFGSVGAIKELRENEKSRNSTAKAGRRN